MNKSMLLAVTLTGVTTSAGAAYAGVSVMQSDPSTATVPTTPATDSVAPVAPVDRTVTYQVGTAGTVTITVAGGVLQVAGASAGAGWSVGATSASGSHAEVQFTDGVQLVTFIADLVGNDVIVSLSNELASDVTTTAPTQFDVTIIDDSATPRPQPAPAPGSSVPGQSTPTTSHTSSPSSGYDDDDEYEDDEYEDESEHEEDEYEEDEYEDESSDD